jgi:hypothetical protein
LDVDHHELRAAFERFLAAKRALRHAYRRSVASHSPDESRLMLEPGASEHYGDVSAMSEALQELKDENERLRKSLTLLYTHCLRIQDQLDTLLVREDHVSDGRGAVASRIWEDPRADEYPGPSVEQLDGAIRSP